MGRRRRGEALTIGMIGIPGIGPIVMLAVWSLAGSWFWPDLLPGAWSLRAWRYLASPSSGVLEALATSLGIALAVALLALGIGWPAARTIASRGFSARRGVIFLLLLPVLAPPLASTMGMHALFLVYGLADTVSGVMLAHLVPTVPYAILVLAGSFTRLDPDLEAQARSLGANWWQVWCHVTMPAMLPGVAVAGVFAFVISWSQYLSTLIIGGGQVLTLPLELVSFQRAGDESMAAALSLFFLAPPVLLFLLVGRFMISGEWRHTR